MMISLADNRNGRGMDMFRDEIITAYKRLARRFLAPGG